MKTILTQVLTFWLFALSVAWSAQSTNETAQLYLPDGQLKSHLVRVYVNRDITEQMKPELLLHAPHSLTHASQWENTPIPFYRLSRDHRWTQPSDQHPGQKQGTLLLFDLHKIQVPPYKAMIRITPTLVWKEAGETISVTGENEIYLANSLPAMVWSVLVIALIALLIAYLSWESTSGSGRPRLARIFAGLANPDGTLSIWRSQLAAWTMAIGVVVFGYGLIRLEVPEIPETLVALMGLSLVTGGLGALGKPVLNGPPPSPAPPANPPAAHPPLPPAPLALPVPPTPLVPSALLPMRLSDLISEFNKETQQREVSVAKAQMVFWTLLTLGIFLTKSVTDGTLWPVPWQMVALMGMSQAGYVTAKFAPEPK